MAGEPESDTVRAEGIVRLLGALVLCVVLPGGRTASSGESRPLRNFQVPDLDRAYGLGVVELPNPPSDLGSARRTARLECPVEVRAIVTGNNRSSTFTVLGWGEQSKLLAIGEGVRTPHGWLAVTSIASDHVILRHGDDAFHCVLGSAATVRRKPAR